MVSADARDESAGPPATIRVAGTVAAFDLRRKVRDRTAILMGIVTPLVMAAVIGLAFGGGFTFDATIAVVDLDGSATSSALVDGLVGGVPGDAPVRLERRRDADAREALRSGAVDAIIVIPAGFGESLPGLAAGGQTPPLAVVIDADKQIAGDVATAIVDGVGVRLGASALAIATALDVDGPPADAATIEAIVEAGQQLDLPITLAQLDVGASYSPVAYFGASMGILFLFFTVGGAARSLVTERREGTLQRVRAAPVSDAAVLTGKVGAVLVVGFVSLLTIWGVTTVAFGADWGAPGAVIAVLAAAVFAVMGISALVAGVARTDAQADGLTAVVAFLFALLGGSFFQPAGLPPILQALALLTPNGWALRAITRIGAGGAGVVDVLPDIAVLLAIGLVTAVAGLRLIRTRVLA